MRFTHGLFVLLGSLSIAGASFNVISMDGSVQRSSKVTDYLAFRGMQQNAPLDTVGITDCTGDNDCSFLNLVLETSLQPRKMGMVIILNKSRFSFPYTAPMVAIFRGTTGLD